MLSHKEPTFQWQREGESWLLTNLWKYTDQNTLTIYNSHQMFLLKLVVSIKRASCSSPNLTLMLYRCIYDVLIIGYTISYFEIIKLLCFFFLLVVLLPKTLLTIILIKFMGITFLINNYLKNNFNQIRIKSN